MSQPVLKVADGGAMAAYLAEPTGTVRGGVLLFQEAFGVTAHIRGLADRLAAEGYVALAPELFHRTSPGFQGKWSDFNAARKHVHALTVAGLEGDIRAAHGYLAAHSGSAGKPLAALGFCMGGRVAMLAAMVAPLSAAVCYYGGGLEALLGRVGEVHCPLLLFWGGRDQHITAVHRRALADALTAADKEFVSVVFSRADHAFNNDEGPRYHAAAARQAWALRQAFFAEHLR